MVELLNKQALGSPRREVYFPSGTKSRTVYNTICQTETPRRVSLKNCISTIESTQTIGGRLSLHGEKTTPKH